jgi:hypothetical protein
MADDGGGNNNTDAAAGSAGYCSIPPDLIDGFDALPFRNTRAVRWMHYIPPRYGKPDDVLLLMTGTEEDQQGKCRVVSCRAVSWPCVDRFVTAPL